MSSDTVLAIDIGGTKMLAALVDGATVVAEREVATPRNLTADGWCDAVAGLVSDWSGRYRAVAAAVTGQVRDGHWYTLNPAILPISSARGSPYRHPRQRRQAAAQRAPRRRRRRDIVFLTVSTGIGGGVVPAVAQRR
jgi:predicted NBD/HSP70 family sugar kinase